MKLVICDLDGSLMPPSSGLYVSDEVKERLIRLQERGNIVVLNSARVIQGVYPCGEQIFLDKFQGYLISCNGCHAMKADTRETIFEYTICPEDALKIWNICLKYDVKPGIAQPEYMICEDYAKGYGLDRNNCEVDYIITRAPEKYIHDSIWKCCVADEKEKLESVFDILKEEIESILPVKVLKSTPYMIDIVNKDVDKTVGVERLLDFLNRNWNDVTVIGDTDSDLGCIQKAQLGVTLENGSDACKAFCDMLVPSCYEDGCLVWLDKLLEE